MAAAICMACRALVSWRRNRSAPATTASVVAAAVAHSRFAAGALFSQDPASSGAEEILPRERHVQRATELLELGETAQDLEVVAQAEVEVQPRVERDLLLRDAPCQGLLDPA